jgi:simple sugar transport system ATP-binding protein
LDGNFENDKQVILEMRDIWKVYPNGVIANSDVNIEVIKGQIHALLGENGAGKTTLMKILFGFEHPSSGKILYEGKEVHITSPHKAIELGIGMVHQHFMLVPSLTVAENVLLGMEPKKGFSIDMNKAFATVRQASDHYGLSVPVDKKIEDISVGMRQRVEIIKTLVRGANLIILDEPTAVLTPQETVELFKALRILVDRGKTVIFITHKLNEVKQIADRITVLRKGQVVGNAEVKDVSQTDMSRMMVGRDVEMKIEKEPSKNGSTLLDVENLCYIREDKIEILKGITFQLRAGEILGIAGVEGNGQTELVQIITGLLRPSTGSVSISGEIVGKLTPKIARKKGMSHIPSDRMLRGVALESTVEENVISDRFGKKPFSSKGIQFPKKITRFTKDLIDQFDIRVDTTKRTVKMLSGGNIQKVVVAREFTAGSKIIIADQPTRGIDVGASDFIRRRLIQERDKGVGVFLVSADLTELLEVSDRIIVFYRGVIVAHFETAEGLTEETLGEYMLGIKQMSEDQLEANIKEGTVRALGGEV